MSAVAAYTNSDTYAGTNTFSGVDGSTYNFSDDNNTKSSTVTDSLHSVFQPGDAVSFSYTGFNLTGYSYYGYVTVLGVNYPLVGAALNTTFMLAPSGLSATSGIFHAASLACFAVGTRIRTPEGDVPVEALGAGDQVVTRDGQNRTIAWIGHRAAAPGQEPIRVRSGAFGAGLPMRDLYLSPEHAIAAEGVLIPVWALVDGNQIAPAALPDVTYYHILLADHDVILAENLPCETLLPEPDDDRFDTALPDTDPMTPVAPRQVQGPAVERVRQRLAARDCVPV